MLCSVGWPVFAFGFLAAVVAAMIAGAAARARAPRCRTRFTGPQRHAHEREPNERRLLGAVDDAAE